MITFLTYMHFMHYGGTDACHSCRDRMSQSMEDSVKVPSSPSQPTLPSSSHTMPYSLSLMMQRSVLLVLECEVNELTLGYGCVEFETLGYGGAKMHKI